ncbi:hypothetical protein ES703_64568 [subsurface metagenome]
MDMSISEVNIRLQRRGWRLLLNRQKNTDLLVKIYSILILVLKFMLSRELVHLFAVKRRHL